ncbi:MAG TPA: T9SS type A sorting domain-containing protein, partial [Lacibacter sp.]|nr:T9SS type A sorting domain-containing protein [Lacibacter sp.]
HQYSYTDATPLNGKNYYRLVQYDIDNKSVYYGIKLLNFELQPQINIMPNPIADHFSISIQSKRSAVVQVTVFDIHGRKITEQTADMRTGTNLIPVDSKEWATGFYTVKIEQGGVITNHRIIKQAN